MSHREHIHHKTDNFIVNETDASSYGGGGADNPMYVCQCEPGYARNGHWTLGCSACVDGKYVEASTPEGHHSLAYVATLTAVYCVAFDPSVWHLTLMSPVPVTGNSPIELERIHSCYTSPTPNTASKYVHSVSIYSMDHPPRTLQLFHCCHPVE